ncbi:hypothetical protein E2C01_035780 [Portunus trituberculatus]|uniref:Uncharacterized protein n=1 Tax=Portunus trituberculatus TaxID=210409 RepID=A0A5B7FA39_PORTR|nr:hypothetical protein [Portunus trituberculatus]
MHFPQTHPLLKIQNSDMSPGRTALLLATQNVLALPSTFPSLISATFAVFDLIFNL